MNPKGLTQPQQQALLDLAMLTMYADGHLAAAEDERIHRLLASMGCTTDYDRGRLYDASVSRVSRQARTPEAAQQFAATLVREFTTREERRCVLEVLDDLVTSDSHVSPQEGSLLVLVRAALQG
jgi:uncharacterized tellurite resistance protein B-like protein